MHIVHNARIMSGWNPLDRSKTTRSSQSLTIQVWARVENTLKAMAAMGHGLRGMLKDVRNWISECAICQKIKYQHDL
jgi:hypothetical protein